MDLANGNEVVYSVLTGSIMEKYAKLLELIRRDRKKE